MIVYLARNTVNGKLYVGKTGREFEVRKREHEYDARNKGKTAFSRAIRKYGFGAFEFTLLETCTPETLDDRERYWIKHHNSRKPHGYNLTDGGDGTLGTKRPDVTARLKAMTGERNHRFGKRYSPEELEVYRQKSLGQNNPRFGIVMSDELKSKISESIKRANANPEIKAKYKKPKSEAHKKAISEARRKCWLDPEYREKQVKALRSRSENPDLKAKFSRKMRELWSTPEYRERMSKRKRNERGVFTS